MVVSCRRGPRTLLPKTAFKVESDTVSYSDLWETVRLQSSGLQHLDVDDISSVKMCHLVSSEEVAIQSLDLPISVGLDLGMKGVIFIVENSESAVLGAGGSTGLGWGPPPRSAFDVLMGSQTEYSVPPYRPSLAEAGITADDRDEDKRNTDTLKSQKVRSSVICADCQKPRCVYAQKKMSSEEVGTRQ